jgi:hypothetical protein
LTALSRPYATSFNAGGADRMTELLAGLIERGELKPGAAKAIRALHRKVLETSEEGLR